MSAGYERLHFVLLLPAPIQKIVLPFIIMGEVTLKKKTLFDCNFACKYKANYQFLYFFSQQWLLDKQDLIRERQHDLAILTEEEYQKIFIFFANCKYFNKFVCYKNNL